MDIQIKTLELFQRDDALELVWKVFLKYEAPDYTKEGADEFFKSIHDDEWLNQIKMYGAFDGDRLVGVIATRQEGTHIALFFVDGEYHRKGIGRLLFQRVLEDNKVNYMTVNSSPYAVPVYEKLGFEATDKEQVKNGLKFTPMKYQVE